MKKNILMIIICLLNYAIIKGTVYCWNLIPVMSTDKQSTLMTYSTLGLFVLELIIFLFSINFVQKYVKSKDKQIINR
ncbi:MAG: hypothetical protein ACERLG_11555 [Sedimentibacter sp.]